MASTTPTSATSLNNLAMLLWRQGDYAAAKPLYEQALAINKAVLGERTPSTATQPEQPGVAAGLAGGLRRRQAPTTSRPWRSARQCWASATPTPPTA